MKYKVKLTYILSDKIERVYDSGWCPHLREAYEKVNAFKKTIDPIEMFEKSYKE